MRKVKICIADDHVMFRRLIAGTLRSSGDGFEIREAGNGRELLKLIREDIPDIAIIDLEMPVMNGFTASENISREFPEVKIIVLSADGGQVELARIRQIGVHAFLSKRAEPEDLETAIRDLASGRVRTMTVTPSPISTDFRLGSCTDTQGGSKIVLTEREYQIVQLLRGEMTNKQIGYHLRLSVNTVRNHKARIMRKAGVCNASGLVRMLCENRFIVENESFWRVTGSFDA